MRRRRTLEPPPIPTWVLERRGSLRDRIAWGAQYGYTPLDLITAIRHHRLNKEH